MDTKIAEKIDKFFTQFKYQEYRKGEILIRADDDPSGIFYLKEGIVKEYAISKKGEELVVNLFKPVAFFPMSWAVNNTPNQYFFESMTELSLWRAPKENVIEFIKANPDVLYNLVSRVYKGVDGVLTRMTYLMSGSAYARLITELIIYAKRFGLAGRISEKDLAAQSGITRETVSREMKILKDKGFITFSRGTLNIKNFQKLEKELMKII